MAMIKAPRQQGMARAALAGRPKSKGHGAVAFVSRMPKDESQALAIEYEHICLHIVMISFASSSVIHLY